MRVLLVSDLHAHNHEQFSRTLPSGRNSRFQDILNVLEQVHSVINTQSVEKVIFLGDMFHSRKSLDIDVYTQTYMAWLKISKLFRGMPTLLVGNHDQYTKIGDVHGLEPFKAFSIVIDTPTIQELDGRICAFFPFTSDADSLREQLEKLEGKAEVVFFHQGLKEATVGAYDVSVKAELSVKDLEKANAKIYFGGHYHKQQRLGNIWYVGSPLQLNFAERNEDKGFLLWDTKTDSVTRIPSSAPKFFYYNFADLPEEEPQGFVRVVCETQEQVDDLSEAFPTWQLELASVEEEFVPRLSSEAAANDLLLVQEYVRLNASSEDFESLTEIGMTFLGEN